MRLKISKKKPKIRGVFNRERALITKISEDRDMQSAIKGHVSEEYFAIPEMREVFSWQFDQFTRFGEVPTLAVLKDEFCDFDAESTDDSMEVLLHRVKSRKLYSDLQAVMLKATEASREDPEEALELMHEAVARLSIAHSDTEDLGMAAGAALVLDRYTEAKIGRAHV